MAARGAGKVGKKVAGGDLMAPLRLYIPAQKATTSTLGRTLGQVRELIIIIYNINYLK